MAASHYPIPGTPRVTSPSPAPSESNSKEGYFGPLTRSLSRAARVTSPPIISEDDSSGSDPDRRRSRTRSRSRDGARRKKVQPLTPGTAVAGPAANGGTATRRKHDLKPPIEVNGHLSPPPRSYWRELSRSPSPLGLIPIHIQFRSFIHRHEIPRKALHVSIGFVTLYLYTRGLQASSIHPTLLTALIPIATVDFVRHRWDAFNRLYIRVLGSLMRESEVHDWNGVIWYLLGAWLALRFFPKDVGVMAILLLSWCDTAASTFGRLWGRYTPKVRRGKSLAGTLAAMVVGVATALLFWGYVAPAWGEPNGFDQGEHAFAFQGRLALPEPVRGLLGWTAEQGSITGNVALGVTSLVAGVIACASEAVDLWGFDDNLTIPVLCGLGLWGYLKVFAS